VIFFLATLVGVSLGLLGSGGSILAVPILKYGAGLSVKQAVATSLATVGAVSALGAGLAWREGRVLLKEGMLFAVVAMLGTVGGVKIANLMSDKLQMSVFVVVMALASLRMAQSKKAKKEAKPEVSWQGGLRALAVGVLTGIAGVGGGFLIVPALVSLFHLPMKKATGTSLLVIALNSMVGMGAYAQTVSLNWGFVAGFAGAAAFGLVVGMRASRRIEDSRLQKLFALGLLLVSGYVIFREFMP